MKRIIANKGFIGVLLILTFLIGHLVYTPAVMANGFYKQREDKIGAIRNIRGGLNSEIGRKTHREIPSLRICRRNDKREVIAIEKRKVEVDRTNLKETGLSQNISQGELGGDEAAVSGKLIEGCWKDPKRGNITIRLKGEKVLATISRYGNRIFSGSIKGITLNLRYDFKNISDLASVLWTSETTPPKKVLNQIPPSARRIGFNMKLVGENKLTGEFEGLWVDWNKESYELNFAKTYTEPTEWKREEIRAKSVSVTDKTFQRKISEVVLGERFWVKATSASGCKEAVDRLTVTVNLEGAKDRETKLILTETGADTKVFRSLSRGILVTAKEKKKTAGEEEADEIRAKAGDKILVRSGLRGATIIVKGIARPKILNKKQDHIADFRQGFPLKFRYPESDIKGYKFYAVVKAPDKETKRILLPGTPERGKKDSLLLKASSPGHYEVSIEGVAGRRPTLKSKPHKVSFYKIDVKHSFSMFKGLKIVTSEWPDGSIEASNLPAKAKFDFSISPSLQQNDSLFVLYSEEGKSLRVFQVEQKEWKSVRFFGQEEIVKLGEVPYLSLSKDKDWQDYQKMKAGQNEQAESIKKEYDSQIKRLSREKEQLDKELFRVGDDIRQRTVFASSNLQSKSDTLKQEEQRLRSELLREMRQKNERLMSNPRADTTLYDKEISRLKELIKLTEKRLKNLDKNIKSELKELKLKKAKLEKRQKAIVAEIKELNKEKAEQLRGLKAQSKTLEDIITEYEDSKRGYTYTCNLGTGWERRAPLFMRFAWGIKSGSRRVLFSHKGFSMLDKGTAATIAKKLNKEINSMFERYKKAGLLPEGFDEGLARQEALRFSTEYAKMLAEVMKKVDYDLDSGGNWDNNLRQNAFFKLIGMKKGLVCEAWQSVVRDWAQSLEAGDVSGASKDSGYKYLRVVPAGTPHNDQSDSHHFNWLVLRDPTDSGKDLSDKSLNAGVALDPWTGVVRFLSWKQMKGDWADIKAGYYRHVTTITLPAYRPLDVEVPYPLDVEVDIITYNNSKSPPK